MVWYSGRGGLQNASDYGAHANWHALRRSSGGTVNRSIFQTVNRLGLHTTVNTRTMGELNTVSQARLLVGIITGCMLCM